MNIPSASEAHRKAELVQTKKLETKNLEVRAALDLLSDKITQAVDETLPHNGTYTIIVPKQQIKKHFNEVMTLFKESMEKNDWNVICEVKRHRLKKFLYFTFGPNKEAQARKDPKISLTDPQKAVLKDANSVDSTPASESPKEKSPASSSSSLPNPRSSKDPTASARIRSERSSKSSSPLASSPAAVPFFDQGPMMPQVYASGYPAGSYPAGYHVGTGSPVYPHDGSGHVAGSVVGYASSYVGVSQPNHYYAQSDIMMQPAKKPSRRSGKTSGSSAGGSRSHKGSSSPATASSDARDSSLYKKAVGSST